MSSPFSHYKPFWLNEVGAAVPQQAAAQQPAGGINNTQQPQPVQDPTEYNIDTSGKPQQVPQQQVQEPQPQAVPDDQQAMIDPTQQAAMLNMDSPAKQIDRQIFDSLSPQEQQIKILKLKELYSDLYDNINQIIKKYDTLGIEYEEFSDPIKKSLSTLYDLKQMISTYILYLFDSKTYIENDIMFNRYLTVLNTIKNATDELRDIKSKDIESAKNPKEPKKYTEILPSTIISNS